MAHIPLAVVIVRGPHNASEPNHESQVQQQLQSISSNVTRLLIDEDTPSDTEWSLLGAHFHNVEDLQLESGFNEELNDKAIPLHWPLKKLQLNSACGALVQSPFVRQGLVHHLNLYFTCNLRFEGPTNDELYNATREAISRGEKPKDFGPDRKIEITYLPELVCEDMSKSLEIWENDALDTFTRMYGALPHLVDNLHTLRLRSTSGLDFSLTGEETFRQILPALENLKVLNLTVGDVFEDPLYLPTLHKVLPPNLTALYFRGPTSLVKSEHWADWLRAFDSVEFLPHLQNIAFVLDLHYDDKQGRYGRREIEPPLDSLHYARRECQSLYDIASKRGIQLEAMPKEPDFQLLRPVDPRW
ncbi:hypothetical protein N7490_009762 [Penicillium lividum]|nr:hypothetical protein N7490_009762 [Penicillium lividum]